LGGKLENRLVKFHRFAIDNSQWKGGIVFADSLGLHWKILFRDAIQGYNSRYKSAEILHTLF
jgi:hypothetical protein